MGKLKLAFGYGAGVPDNAQAAWGARAIAGRSNFLDVPPDRYSFAGEDGPKAKLIEKLKAINPIKVAEDKLPLLSPSDEPVELYEDSEFAVVGRLFGGYFYLAAYLKAEEPGILLPRKATGDLGTAAGGPIWLKLIRKVLDSEDQAVFKLLDVGPGEDGQYREAYEGADIVFPSYDQAVVRVVPKSDEAEAVIKKALVGIS
jgi:hypothetical protein